MQWFTLQRPICTVTLFQRPICTVHITKRNSVQVLLAVILLLFLSTDLVGSFHKEIALIVNSLSEHVTVASSVSPPRTHQLPRSQIETPLQRFPGELILGVCVRRNKCLNQNCQNCLQYSQLQRLPLRGLSKENFLSNSSTTWSLGISIALNSLITSTTIPTYPMLQYNLTSVSIALSLTNRYKGFNDSKTSNAAVGIDVITPVTLRHARLWNLVNLFPKLPH